MTASPSLLAYIHRLLGPSAAELGSDAELLQRFVCTRDQAAFSALVARHGPMVLRLCRRVLSDVHAAEDACQAAFLILARKADRIRHPETLSSWLHGVAYRLALKARAANVRRRQIETQRLHFAPAPSSPDPLTEVSAREFLAILDVELQRLPEKYRLPLILCCLEGRSQPEAARLLDWTPGSVKGRLERGRAKLHRRLLRRGLTLSAALLALEATRDAASARLPALLSAAILRIASTAESACGISTTVLALAEGSIGGMASAQVKLMSVLMLALALVAGGFGALAYPQVATHTQKEQQKAEPVPTAQQSRQAKQPQPRLDRYDDPLPPGVLARLGTIRLRRGYEVFRLSERDAFLSVSPENENTAISVWRMSTGELLRRSELHLSRHRSVVDCDGNTLAVAGYEEQRRASSIILLDVRTGKVARKLAIESDTYALAFAPDGKSLASAGAGKVLRLWDLSKGTERRRIESEEDGWWHLAFSPDGKILASAGLQKRTVQLWDVATGKPLRTLGEGVGMRSSVVFSPDGKTLATASQDDKIIRLWDVATGKEVRQFQSASGICCLAFSPDSKVLAAGCTPAKDWQLQISPIHLWEVRTGKEIQRLPGHVFTVASLAFSADGKRLISGSSSAVMRIWDVETGKEALPLPEHESWVMSVAFSPDGRSLATGSLDGTIRLWEPATGKLTRVFEGGTHPQILHVAFSPDGRTLVSDQSDGSLRVWDIATGRQIQRFKVGKDRYSYPFASSPDGQTLAVWREDGSVRLLDAATGKERQRLRGDPGDSTYLCFSPDSRKLAVLSFAYGGRRAGILRVWDAATGKEKRKWGLEEPGPIVFSPDNQTVLGGMGHHFLAAGVEKRTLHACDMNSGEDHPFSVNQHARINTLTISPDGRMLAWGDQAGTVTLWDRAAQQVRRRWKGNYSYVLSLAFSPDGKTLASGNADTTALIWDVTGQPSDAPMGSPSAERLAMLWTDLASNDAAKAFDAIGLLTTAPEQAVPLLKSKLHPAPEPVEPKEMARLIAQLNNDEFALREKAQEQLRQFGERAEPSLREALKDKLTLEMRKRIEELLEGVRTASVAPENLRTLRAVEVLEHIGTAEARQVLKTLANGAASARLTREAKASLERLSKRRNQKP